MPLTRRPSRIKSGINATLSRRKRGKGPSLNRESPLPPGEGQGEGLFKSERNFVVEIAAWAFAAA